MPRLGTVCLALQTPTDGSHALPQLEGLLPVAYILGQVFTTVFVFCVLQEIFRVPLCVHSPESPPFTETPSGLKNNLKTFFVYSRHQSLVVSYSGSISVEWAICLPVRGILHGAEILRTYCLLFSLSHGDLDEIAFFFFFLILHLVFVTLLQAGAGSNPQGAA